MSEVAHRAVPGSPKVVWDDFGRPRFVHLCRGVLTDEPLPIGGACIVLNTAFSSIYCPACETHGFWVNGEWRSA